MPGRSRAISASVRDADTRTRVRPGRARHGQSGTTIPFATVSLAGNRVVGSTRFLNIAARDSRVEIGATWVAVPFQRSIERLGAQFEGIHRKRMLQPDGTRRDSAWYSIVDDEWPGVTARLEARLERH